MAKSVAPLDPGESEARPLPGGLDDERVTELLGGDIQRRRSPHLVHRPPQEGAERWSLYACGAERTFGVVLVHAADGRERPAPRIGDTQGLQQRLHGAVFAAGAVKADKGGVG